MMHNKLLSLLVIFIGLPSFMLTKGEKIPQSVNSEQELKNLRLANKVTINYIKYKVENVKSDSAFEGFMEEAQ